MSRSRPAPSISPTWYSTNVVSPQGRRGLGRPMRTDSPAARRMPAVMPPRSPRPQDRLRDLEEALQPDDQRHLGQRRDPHAPRHEGPRGVEILGLEVEQVAGSDPYRHVRALRRARAGGGPAVSDLEGPLAAALAAHVEQVAGL